MQIQYDLTDNEQASVSIEMEYWDETSFKEAITTTGEGLQNIGTQKIITWNPIVDYPGYDGYTKIKIIADDEQEINKRLERCNSALGLGIAGIAQVDGSKAVECAINQIKLEKHNLRFQKAFINSQISELSDSDSDEQEQITKLTGDLESLEGAEQAAESIQENLEFVLGALQTEAAGEELSEDQEAGIADLLLKGFSLEAPALAEMAFGNN